MIINNIPNKSDSGGSSLRYSNLVLEAASFVTFTAEDIEEQKLVDDGYIYRASLSVEGIQENMTPEMVLSTSDIVDSNADISNLCRCYNGGVYSYSKKVPTKDIAVLTLEVSWNDIDPGTINMVTPETIGAARAAHASRHSLDGSDPITSEMIGAVSSEDFKATVVRPNLLDNWYFGNPVNQRGQTEYTGPGYTIDRWEISVGASTSLEIVEDGILFAPTSSGNGVWQQLEFGEKLAGKTVTFSVLGESLGGDAKFRAFFRAVVGGEYRNSSSSYIKDGMALTTAEIPEGTTHVVVAITGDTPLTPCKIKACKLEIGSGQTLAHQDADGNWVLNEIPNYTEELAKCQRYQIVFGSETKLIPLGAGNAISATEASITVPLPVSMRAKPTLTLAKGNIAFRNGSSTKLATNVRMDVCGPGCAYVRVTSSELTIGYACEAWLAIGSELILDANL